MSELRKLREEQSKKWLEETRIKNEIKAKEEETKRKAEEAMRLEEEAKRKEAKTQKEKNDMWRHERLHAEIASKVESIEEANLMLEAHQAEFDFPLIKFMDGSLDFYKTRRVQEKYGIVREADETKMETLLGAPTYNFHPDLPPVQPPPLPFQPPPPQDDPLLQLAIHASLNT